LSELSECLSPILYNIQNRKLPEAYNELVHCDSHVSRILAEENITDQNEQKEFLIKNFDANVPEVTLSVYKNRADHQNLCKNFIPINVSYTAATILNNNNNCEVIANLLQDVSEQVINNAQLCQLDYIPEIQDHLIQSLHVIREPKSAAEFIVHVTIMDQVLTDIQCQTDAMVTGKPTLWERSPDLLFRALVSFVSRLNPVTQIQDIGSLFVGAGTLLGNRVLDIVTDPITTTKNSIETTLYVIDFISTLARLTSDTTYGLHYLSTQEGQQRVDKYCENIVILGHVIDKSAENITAEQVADATGQILGDIVFAMGAPAVATFVKEIDVLGKVSNEAKVIARGIKSIAEEHPAYVTAEGVVLKMAHEIKDVGNKVKPLINSEKHLEIGSNVVKIENALSAVNQTEIAILKNGYYEVNGFKFSEFYYNRLWTHGRQGPSLIAKEVLETSYICVPDTKKIGFFRYECEGWEMIYNPVTKEVWHLMQIG
jgi:hypothetical protein